MSIFNDAQQRAYPDPTTQMLNGDPLFDAIWEAIKDWDIQRYPHAGYAGASGNDVRRIYDAIKAIP